MISLNKIDVGSQMNYSKGGSCFGLSRIEIEDVKFNWVPK